MRLDPDHRKYLKILLVVALFGPLLFLVGKQKCGWMFGGGEDPAAVHDKKLDKARKDREVREARQKRARERKQTGTAETPPAGDTPPSTP